MRSHNAPPISEKKPITMIQPASGASSEILLTCNSCFHILGPLDQALFEQAAILPKDEGALSLPHSDASDCRIACRVRPPAEIRLNSNQSCGSPQAPLLELFRR